jgi:hypothetical protein
MLLVLTLLIIPILFAEDRRLPSPDAWKLLQDSGFDPRGACRAKGGAHTHADLRMEAAPFWQFYDNTRVDPGSSPEHRESAALIDSQGDLLVTYAERVSHFNTEFIMFTRSGDHGATWMSPATTVNDVSGNATLMPSIAQLDDDTIGVAWDMMNFAPYNYEIRFAASTNGGASFDASVRVHPPDASTSFYRPWITAVGNTFYVAYIKKIQTYTGHILLVTSTDGGKTWNAPLVVNSTHPIDTDGEPPKITHNPIRNELAVVWEYNDHIWFSKSLDYGATWGAPVRITDADTDSPDYPEMAVDSTGRYVVAWDDFRDDWVDVFIDSSMDGVTWRTDKRVNDPYVSGNQYEPHIAIGQDDTIYLVWNRNIPFGFDVDLYYTHSKDGGTTWFEPNPRVNDVPAALIPYVTWSSEIVADPWRAYIFWNDGRVTGYYDHIYFTWSGPELWFGIYR